MADVSGIETFANHTNSAPATTAQSEAPTQSSGDGMLRRILLFIGLVVAAAVLAYAIVRATLTRTPVDPTTERIQQLIDEANRLLKQLDEKKPD